MLSKPRPEQAAAILTESAHIGPSEAGVATVDPGDLAIRVSGLSKCYTIYDRPHDRLKQAVLPYVRHLVGDRAPKQYYREFWALRDVSFHVRKGETVGIIGRNGAGKSTLLQLLCGTLNPTAGQVEIQGRVAALLELGSGFNPEFTGRENVYLYASLLGLRGDEVDARFDDIAAFADIGAFLDMPVKTYSSGMFVRLAFAVIAHVNADSLIIDEALAVGDAFFVQKCMRFLRKFMERGTILFVSHDTGAVVNLCQRAIWLDGGSIRAVGSPKNIAEAYLAALYEAQQGSDAEWLAKSQTSADNKTSRQRRDAPQTHVNHPTFRNDMDLFHLPGAANFGKGGASVIGVELSDASGSRLNMCVGGENVVLRIRCEAHEDLFSPIIGFFIKDRLGQWLFGDNTYLTYADRPLNVGAGQQFEATFNFRMPMLLVGDYSVCVAIAEGTQGEHVQHHWIHDAVLFKSHSSSACTGLVGIPMHRIEIGIV
jgi:lipopolysaccharide transport system ATP-binding protein